MKAVWIDGADRPVVVELTKDEARMLMLTCRDIAEPDPERASDGDEALAELAVTIEEVLR